MAKTIKNEEEVQEEEHTTEEYIQNLYALVEELRGKVALLEQHTHDAQGVVVVPIR